MRLFILCLLLGILPTLAQAGVWMTREQAAEHWFPGKKAEFRTVTLTAEAVAALKELLKPHATRGRGWSLPGAIERADVGKACLLVVEEVGKHQPIRFAVAIDAQGAVLGVDILEYRENYGHQIRQASFLAQYQHKRWEDPIRSPGDIDAISGATYSSYASNRAVRKALALLKVTEKR